MFSKVLLLTFVGVAVAQQHYSIPDTPEVAQAKAEHFRAVAEAMARNAQVSQGSQSQSQGHYAPQQQQPQFAPQQNYNDGEFRQFANFPSFGSFQQGSSQQQYQPQPQQYQQQQYQPQPQQYQQQQYQPQQQYQQYQPQQQYQQPQQYQSGQPAPVQDHPDVAAAKAEHFRAVAEAAARNGVNPQSVGVPAVAQSYAQHGPAQDTPEVAQAKAEHFRAVEAARARAQG